MAIKKNLRVKRTEANDRPGAHFDETAGGTPAQDAPKAPEQPMKRLNTNVPAELHKKLKQIALERNQSMTEIVSDWIKSL